MLDLSLSKRICKGLLACWKLQRYAWDAEKDEKGACMTHLFWLLCLIFSISLNKPVISGIYRNPE